MISEDPTAKSVAIPGGLICPDCGHALISRSGALSCSECGRNYVNRNGVNVLLPSRIPTPSLEDIRAWDESGSGRVEHSEAWRALLAKEAQIRHVERLLSGLDLNGKDVLEIGGGICCGSLAVKHRYPASRVIATDIAPSALEIAQSVAKIVTVSTIRYDAV